MKFSATLQIQSPALELSMALVPWDSKVFDFPVAHIESIQVRDARHATAEFKQAWQWLDAQSAQIVSCRLKHEQFAESFLLESEGFRFIEMVLHPRIASLEHSSFGDHALSVCPAVQSDLPKMISIANSVFGCERFHVDPRVDSDRANLRYANWVESTLIHPKQRLFKVVNGGEIVALFVVETLESKRVYWHLTAVAAHLQGKGFGLRAWRAMLNYHQLQGVSTVETTISARNTRVLNLYARLGFHFLPPESTFHFVR